MKYVVKKSIPLINSPLKKGDTIDSEDSTYQALDFTDKTFFEIYIKPLFDKGDNILFRESNYQNYSLYTVVESINNGCLVVTNGNKSVTIGSNEVKKLKKPTEFWFVNSNGEIIGDYEERPKLNRGGINFKKAAGNYHKDKDSAVNYRTYLLLSGK